MGGSAGPARRTLETSASMRVGVPSWGPTYRLRSLSAAGMVIFAGRCAKTGETAVTSSTGAAMPDVPVVAANGQAQPLRQSIGRDGTFVIVVGPEDCLGCADVLSEIAILRRMFPLTKLLLLAGGGDQSTVRDFIRANQLEDAAVIDSTDAVRAALRVSGPQTLVVNGEGRIVFIGVDWRQDPGHRRPSRQIADVFGVLQKGVVHDSLSSAVGGFLSARPWM